MRPNATRPSLHPEFTTLAPCGPLSGSRRSGCPKNQVDSDKLGGKLVADGYEAASDARRADLVVVNTCAFVEEARQESIDTDPALADEHGRRRRLVVTGCMAERYGDELAGTARGRHRRRVRPRPRMAHAAPDRR
jgi:hypothetical protein